MTPVTCRGLAVLAIAASTLSAQAPLIYPNGKDIAGGDGYQHFLFSNSEYFHQQLTSDARGQTFKAKSIAFRRDELRPSREDGTRTVQVEILMGPGSLAAFGSTFAKNYTSAPTTVVKKRNYKFPWLIGVSPGFSSFELRFPFDQQYSHTSGNDLVFQTHVTGPYTGKTIFVDHDSIGFAGYSTSTALSVGCKSATQFATYFEHEMKVQYYYRGDSTHLAASFSGAAPGSDAHAMIGLSDPNLAIPGLCTRLRSDASIFTWNMGRAHFIYGIGSAALTFGKYQASWSGLSLYSQAYCPDTRTNGIPVRLTGGLKVTLPALILNPLNLSIQSDTKVAVAPRPPSGGNLVFRLER